MTGDHRDVRDSLGAYVLGALDPDERHRVEAHLQDCRECTDQVARLTALPGLLSRVSEDELASGRLVPSEDLLDGVLDELAGTEHDLRRSLRRWRTAAATAAAAAAAALLLVLAPWQSPPPSPDRVVAPVDPAAPAAAATSGEAAAIAWEWGTTVEVDVADLPARPAYQLWAVGEGGRRERAGTWGPTASHDALVRGASSIARSRLARVEVTDPGGTVLLTFDF